MYKVQLIIITSVIILAASDELLLLQAIWRHGDRAPIASCKSFPIQTEHWPQGMGQLTVEGMIQQVKLGKIIYSRYVDSLKFLSPYYDPRQIYVRSTDVNRTLMSAVANFIGFYNNPFQHERVGIDFPNITEWPQGFIPVPVHTVMKNTDDIGIPDVYCPRQQWLLKLVQKTSEWKNLTEKYMEVLKELETICNQSLDFEDVPRYVDAFYCEKLHAFEIPITDLLYDRLEQLSYEIQNYKNGLDLQPYEGIDFRREIGKIRGGSILWSILDHFDLKLYCLKPENYESSHCTWMKDLKYYVYSAHDTTLAALMCTLDAKHKILANGGYPKYTAAMFFELWNTTNGPGLKIYYHRNFTEEQLENITDLVDHCSEHTDPNGFCNYNKFRTNGIAYYPGNKNKLCQDIKSKKTSFHPEEYERKATPTVTVRPAVLILLLSQVLIT